jgi:NAD+ diphosphatase
VGEDLGSGTVGALPDRKPAAPPSAFEPSGPAFSGVTLDRAMSSRRDQSWVARQRDAPHSRVVAAGTEGVLLDRAGPMLLRIPLGSEVGCDGEPLLLGLEGDVPLFAIDIDSLEPAAAGRLVQAARIVGLRDAGALLSRSEGGLAAYLVALLNWHRRHRFCANCGAITELAEAGYSRKCPSCTTVHFPRTDPVVIMLVESDGRVLLGRRAGWPPGRYSVLAGFVSPGESAEEAVVREVYEESGVAAYDPRYVRSQPWPFPSSLMLGFEARSDGGEATARDGELDDVRWFTRDAVRSAALAGGTELVLPPRVSIARFLIERWVSREGLR